MAAKHLEAVEAVLSGPGLQESKGWGVADFMQELKKVPQRHPIDASRIFVSHESNPRNSTEYRW